MGSIRSLVAVAAVGLAEANGAFHDQRKGLAVMGYGFRRIVLSFGFTVVTGLTVALLSAPAEAAFPGSNGKIVFRTNRDGNAEIYTMNADGTGRVNLTRNPAEDVDPRWSPDGTRIAFASDRTHIFQIYTMNADGTDVRQLTTLIGHNRRPSWTADGRILFQSDVDDPAQASDIFVMNADGSGVTNLTNSPGIDDAFAAASPRGGKIVFSSDRSGEYRLYLMNGSAPVRELTSGGEDIEANWSPSGNDLVFVRFDSSFARSELYTVHSDGTGLTRLTSTAGRTEVEPAWSPDGTKVVFHACSGSGDNQHCANYEMNADGSGETEVSLLPHAPYVDTFSGDWIDPFWSTHYLVGSGPSFAQTNGRLEITVPASATLDQQLGFADTGLMSNCLLSGNWDMQVDYQLLDWPSDNGVLQVFQAGNFVSGQFVNGDGMFRFNPGGTEGLSTNFPDVPNVFLLEAALSGTLRLARQGSTITAYRLSAGAWMPILSGAYSADSSDAALTAFTSVATRPDVKVAFDNFRISSGQVTCPSWWGDDAPDWQPILR